MISPIGSGYSSPAYIGRPDLSEIQEPSISPSSSTKKVGSTKGIAEYQDAFVSASPLQQNPYGPQQQNPFEKIESESVKTSEADNRKKSHFKLSLNNDQIDENGYKWIRRYEHLRMIHEAQKAEHMNAYHPGQPGAAHVKPLAEPVASLTADLTANMLSMIRV